MFQRANFIIKITDQKKKINSLKDYLDEELEKICLLNAKSNEFIDYEEAMEIYKQIQDELSSSQYYDYDYEIEALTQEFTLNSPSCICPICQKFLLKSDLNSIYCSNCDFKINARKSDGDLLSLECLAQMLNEAVKEHGCSEIPAFQLVSDDDRLFLMMSCDKCNFMKVIV